MRTTIRYTETLKQVLGMIFIPIAYMFVFTAFILWLSGKIAEDLWIILVFAGIILVMIAAVRTIFRFIMEAGEAVFNEEGLQINLNRKTFLYPYQSFFIPYANIAEAGFDEEPGKGPFFSLKTRVPKKSLLIFSETYEDTESFTAFWQGLQREMNRNNLTGAASLAGGIQGKSFYESPWIRGIAIFSAGTAIVLTFMRWSDPEFIAGWKLLGFYCYVIPLCYLVFKKPVV